MGSSTAKNRVSMGEDQAFSVTPAGAAHIAPIAGLMIYSASGECTWADDTAAQLLGVSRELLSASNWSELKTQEGLEFPAVAAGVLHAGRARFLTGHLAYAAGEGRWLDIQLLPVEVSGEPLLFVALLSAEERRQMEEALRESERRHRDLADTTADLVFSFDQDLMLTAINRAAAGSLGAEPRELVGRRISDLGIPDENRRSWESKCGEVLRSGLPAERMLNEFTLADGQRHTNETSLWPVFAPDGKVVGVRGVAHDVTEVKQTGELLETTEQRYRTVFDSANDGIVVHDLEGHILEANAVMCARLGLDAEEILQRNVTDVRTAEGAAAYPAYVKEILAKGRAVTETCHLSQDGKVIPVEVSARLAEIGTRQLVLSISRDISERKRIEEELVASEGHFRALIENASDLVAVLDVRGVFEFQSPSSYPVLGYRPEEMVGRECFDFLHPDDFERIRSEFADLVQGHWDPGHSIELRFVHKDGSLRVLEVKARELIDSEGKISYVLNSRDITERERIQEALRESEERYRMLFDTMLEGFSYGQMIYDDKGLPVDWIYLAVNKAFYELTGLSDVVGKKATEIIPGFREVFPELLEVCDRVGVTGQPERFTINDAALTPWLDVSLSSPAKGYVESVFTDISERMRTEEALRRTQFSVDHAAYSLIWIDPEGRIVDVGESTCRRLEYSRVELLGMTIFDIDPLFPRDTWPAHWQKIKSQGSFTFESAYRTKNGRVTPQEVTTNYVAFGGREYNCSFSHDISARKQLEESLRLTQLSMDCAADLVHWLNPKGRIIYANDASCTRHGYLREEMLGMSIWDLDPSLSAESWSEEWRSHKKRAPFSIESLHRAKDGEMFPVEVSVNYVTYGDKEYEMAFLRDVSERRRAEEAVRESEAKTRSILDNIGIGVALISPKMEIVEMNQRMREWFPKIDPNQHPICYRAFNDPPREAVCDYCPTQKTLKDSHVHEATTQTPRIGGTRSYRVVSSPILNGAGEVAAAIEMVEDITEKLSLESQLRQSQKMEAVGQLAGGIAHDFNNLLTTIIGGSSLALAAMDSDDPNRQLVADISEAGERAAALTRQILAFSRRQVLRPEVIALSEVVLGMEPLLRRTLGEDIDLIFSLEPDLMRIEADPHQIEQVLMNLTLNSRDAMPRGGSLTVKTSNVEIKPSYCRTHLGAKPGQHVMLAVSDTGSGMDEDTKSRIFEPFFTTKEAGKGTGLGLSTVFGIVKQSNGYISVDSEPGKGTDFRVYLPVVDAGRVSAEALRPETQSRGGSETILVVEDESSVRALVTTVLSRAGYQVVQADSLQGVDAALDRSEDTPALLLTDVVLPGGGSGRDVADMLLQRYQGLRVIYMSGYTRNSVVHDGRLDEGIEYLEKPFTPASLLRKVRAVLDLPEDSTSRPARGAAPGPTSLG
jgi:two-component system cell cycle sensor histidine kinase/response regulator CckA